MGTPNQPPWRVLAALLLASASFCYCTHLWRERATPLEAAYLVDYLRVSTIQDGMKYTTVYAGKRLALPTDIGTLTAKSEKVNVPVFSAYLHDKIYGESVWMVLLWPLGASGLILFVGLAFAFIKESDTTRDGKLLRGARIVSHWRWNLPVWLRPRNKGFHILTK